MNNNNTSRRDGLNDIRFYSDGVTQSEALRRLLARQVVTPRRRRVRRILRQLKRLWLACIRLARDIRITRREPMWQ